MTDDLTTTIQSAVDHTRNEVNSIRTGRANPALVEQLPVAVYNSVLPMLQLASITVPDARTILIQPWDRQILKDIEQALRTSELGMNPVNDGTAVRLIIPALTEERRREYVKILGQKLEHGRITLRKIREDHVKTLKIQKQQKEISEDDYFAGQKKIQKDIDVAIELLDTIGEQKEKEIMTV